MAEGVMRLAALLVMALAAGCASAPRAGEEAGAKGPLTVLAVGESTTALGGSEGWPARLEALLAAECPGARVKAWAVPGMESAEAAARLPAGLSIHKPHAVIAMLGINDYEGDSRRLFPPGHKDDRFLRETQFRSEEEYEARLAALMREKPWNDRRFVYLFARPYRDSGRLAEAKKLLEELRALHPENPWIAAELGTIARMEGKLRLARRLHEIAFGAALDEPHMLLEWLADYPEEKEFEATRQKAAKLTRNRRPADFVAASFYQSRGLRQKHEDIMRKIVKDGCANRKCMVMLKVALERNGKKKEADAIALPPFPAPLESTKANLETVAMEARAAGAALFLMQYPLMPAAPLEGLLTFAALRPVAVIPNEANFRAALERQPYDALFLDRFAGDFGHFKAPAARLVAESAHAHLLPWARGEGFCR